LRGMSRKKTEIRGCSNKPCQTNGAARGLSWARDSTCSGPGNVFRVMALFFNSNNLIYFGGFRRTRFLRPSPQGHYAKRWPGDGLDPGWWDSRSLGSCRSFTNLPAPIDHLGGAAAAALAGWSESAAYHVVVATFYSLWTVDASSLVRLCGGINSQAWAIFDAGSFYKVLIAIPFLIPTRSPGRLLFWQPMVRAAAAHGRGVGRWAEGWAVDLWPILRSSSRSRSRTPHGPQAWVSAAVPRHPSAFCDQTSGRIALAMGLGGLRGWHCEVGCGAPRSRWELAAAATGADIFPVCHMGFPPSSLDLVAQKTPPSGMSPRGRFHQ